MSAADRRASPDDDPEAFSSMQWALEDEETEPVDSPRARGWQRAVAVGLVVLLVAPILIATALQVVRVLE